MNGICSTHGLREEMHIKFWLLNLKGRDHSGNLAVDGKIILKWIIGKWEGEDVCWIHRAQERNQWRTSVNSVMKFRVS
jgi:hypothetical protein